MESHPPHSTTKYFHSTQSWFGGIEDDHIPFESRGVPIVHVIPTPFPEVWHKDSDNRQNIHFPTVNNLVKIFKIFVAQYLHLDIDQ
jgi:glutaminyl-peptide cyclotransferase